LYIVQLKRIITQYGDEGMKKVYALWEKFAVRYNYIKYLCYFRALTLRNFLKEGKIPFPGIALAP